MKRHVVMPLLLTALAAVLVYSLVRQTRPQRVATTVNTQAPQYALQDVDLTRYGPNGLPRITAHAAEIDRFAGGRTTGTDLTVTTLRGVTPWTATAPQGALGGRNQPLQLSGGVVARGRWPDDGQALTVTTPELSIDTQTHELYTSAPVKLSSAHRNGTAVGLRANWLNQTLSLLDQVHLSYDTPAAH
ncbi:MAG TPA: LPS export ABC transporter periplasmic protein LptC [Nevskiaceae bacterium]|nr:LPS export ABC transporter periplasmic protein LptC [Nevskiaceae bacterium]